MADLWIPTYGPSRRVSRLHVSPAPALGLLEFQTVGEGEQVTNLFYLEGRAGREFSERIIDALAELAK